MHIYHDAQETYLWATAYLCIFCAYSVHIYTYFNLPITAPLLLCIFKHTLHVWAYNSHVYAYFENAYLSGSVYFEQELRVLSLVQRRGALPIKDRRKEPKRRLALTAGGRSSVSVLATSSESCLFFSCNSSAVCGRVDSRMASVSSGSN